MTASQCGTIGCGQLATHHVDWRESGGRYCDDCTDRLRRWGDNVHPVASGKERRR